MATKQINHITFQRLANAYHVAFFSNVKAGIDKYEYNKLGIDDENYARFCDALEREQDIVNRSRASALTRELQGYDTLRDNYFRRIYYKLRNAENDSQNPAMTPELIQNIQVHFLNTYGLNICNEPNQKETAKLRGFIKDLRQFVPSKLETLEIANDLTILEQANDNYEKTYMARVAEYAALPASTSLREATEQAYLALSFLIMTLANNPSPEQADMMHARLCERLINELNLLIKDFKSKAYAGSSSSDDIEEDDGSMELENQGSMESENDNTEEV